MSVENNDVVDIVSIDTQTGDVILTVSDHLEWSDSMSHQEILQTKLNRYLAFLESGELLETYPDAKGRRATIKVVFKHTPDESGSGFLERAKSVIVAAGINFRCETFAASYDK